jgi:hypothetical protein
MAVIMVMAAMNLIQIFLDRRKTRKTLAEEGKKMDEERKMDEAKETKMVVYDGLFSRCDRVVVTFEDDKYAGEVMYCYLDSDDDQWLLFVKFDDGEEVGVYQEYVEFEDDDEKKPKKRKMFRKVENCYEEGDRVVYCAKEEIFVGEINAIRRDRTNDVNICTVVFDDGDERSYADTNQNLGWEFEKGDRVYVDDGGVKRFGTVSDIENGITPDEKDEDSGGGQLTIEIEFDELFDGEVYAEFPFNEVWLDKHEEYLDEKDKEEVEEDEVDEEVEEEVEEPSETEVDVFSNEEEPLTKELSESEPEDESSSSSSSASTYSPMNDKIIDEISAEEDQKAMDTMEEVAETGVLPRVEVEVESKPKDGLIEVSIPQRDIPQAEPLEKAEPLDKNEESAYDKWKRGEKEKSDAGHGRLDGHNI